MKELKIAFRNLAINFQGLKAGITTRKVIANRVKQ